MRIKDLKVSTRLAGAFGLVLAISVIAAALSIAKLAAIQDNLRDIVQINNVKIQLNTNMADALHVVARVMRSVVLLHEPAEKEREKVKIAKAREDYDQSWTALEKFAPNPQAKALRVKIDEAKNLSRPLNNKVIELGMGGKEAEAIALLFKEANPAWQKWLDALEENIAVQQKQNQEQFQQTEAEYVQARTMLIVANALSIALAIVLGWMVTRSITRQLGGEPAEAAKLAQAVASGDLSVHIALHPNDNHSMMSHLKHMQESLVQVVGSVRQGSEGVSTASAEIAQGNHDLSARTEAQASSLEETAASMEQLSATVKQNADSARQANQLAISASSVAVKGGEVVGQVVDTMRDINASSHKISDIIGVIDGIAFQTNILALNAAVEAARAGEQGRGFAVVATEVRSLAGRSAEAAKEIKALIGASVERVEMGTRLVGQAGTTMSEVVNSIQRVADLMGEISAASNEQSAGVAQVGEAVIQMDQVTQQNAALVEEMAAAASSLKSQAQELVQTVSVFKLDANDASSYVTPTPSPALHRVAPVVRKLGTLVKSSPLVKGMSRALPVPASPKPALAAADGDWSSF
ncbi:methyl-accepting chemotaxis protein [Rhodoferax saidenbachensis]|uniref:Methyl-accepting chemotaxis protein n=1 Tax=Rhodoferax saidenbachensis TaxID=1484693 RepID=A0A1P8KE11_9BURK|nr:methyl-accepting chemotaxis protein [Rhodoferax saidenbachensis]APW44244.1 methyl-accepting chemotaxis protein [Rhodoferax saidenbachensis]